MTAQEPHSLLFLSCDIVGSTAYKQRRNALWQKTFLSFYRVFPQMVGEHTREKSYDPNFNLWKPIGDELIFTSRVRTEADVNAAVHIWLDAMREYEESVLGEEGLATKGGAFIATFPGPDSQSSIPRDPLSEKSDKGVVELNDEAIASQSPDYLFDYFGPSIDTGFRVINACSRRYFTMSVEVAWAIARHLEDSNVISTHELLLLDTREFKGVWDGRAYPLFALDRDHEDPVNRALAKIHQRELKASAVLELCKQCSAKPNWPSALYLPDSANEEFKATPIDSLAPMRDNSMEGAESIPPAEGSGPESLSSDAPLG